MKKITILLFTMLFLLTSCYSNPEDTKKIEELESTNNQQNELIKTYEKTIVEQSELIENNKLESLKKIVELEDSIEKEREKSEDNNFKKEIECSKYGESIEYNSQFMYTNDSTRFYSKVNNTCIITNEVFYKNNNRLYEITNSITGEQILFEMCPLSNTCKIAESNYKNKLDELKN